MDTTIRLNPIPQAIPSRHSAKRTRHRVAFFCDAPKAKHVRLLGDFNGWNFGATPMCRMPDGRWTTSLELPHGHHRYLFLVDGMPTLDPKAYGKTRGDAGEPVSLVGVFPRLDAPPVRHHLELANAGETVITVHPRYLRIRVFAALPGARHLPGAPLLPIPFGPSLLQELSSLYRGSVARTVPRLPDRSQLSAGQASSPDPRNVGEFGWASGALGEEWTQMFEQPLKPTAGPADTGSKSPSRQVLHNQA